MAAKEDGPRVPDRCEQRRRVGHHQLQMLGRKRIRQGGCLGQVLHQDDRAIGVPAVARDLVRGKARQQALHPVCNRIGKRGAVGDQDRLGDRVMLRLAQQVGRDPVGPGRGIRDHQDLAGPGHHVDADRAVKLALRFGDPGVAGPHDDVALRKGRGAIGKRRDRLRAAHPEHPRHTRQLGRQHRQRIEPVVGRRRRHHQLVDPGHLRWNGVHQHRRGIGRPPARHIEAGTLHRSPSPAGAHAGCIAVAAIGRALGCVEGADPPGSQLQRCPLVGRHPGNGGSPLGGRNLGTTRRQVHPVEPLGQVGNRPEPLALHPFEDLGDLACNPPVGLPRVGHQGRKAPRKIGVGG